MTKTSAITISLLLSLAACGPESASGFGDDTGTSGAGTDTLSLGTDTATADLPSGDGDGDGDGTTGWPGDGDGDEPPGDGDGDGDVAVNGVLWGPCMGAGFTGACDPWMNITVVCLVHPGTSICAPSLLELDPACDTAPVGPDGTYIVGPYGLTCAPKCTSELECPSSMVCADPWAEVDSGACGWPIHW